MVQDQERFWYSIAFSRARVSWLSPEFRVILDTDIVHGYQLDSRARGLENSSNSEKSASCVLLLILQR
jgi:hypothetical protein